jgi:alpha-glucosidase
MPFFDRDGVHEIYRAWRKIFDEYKNRMTVGEAFVYPTSRLANYVRPDELHQIFNFDSTHSSGMPRRLKRLLPV